MAASAPLSSGGAVAGSVEDYEAVARRTVRAKHLTPQLQSRYRVTGAQPLHAPRHVEATRQLFRQVPDWCGPDYCGHGLSDNLLMHTASLHVLL